MTPTLHWCPCDDNDNYKDTHKDKDKGKIRRNKLQKLEDALVKQMLTAADSADQA